ncbi:MAG: hypothetical protein IH613_06770 [Desulfuromonadales bacterium]|nr:hypothetical protein [Desulfuromonadales bacterium]
MGRNYQLSPLEWFLSEEGDVIECYSARGALVMKSLAIVLTRSLLPELSINCHHLKGRGGVPGALRRVQSLLPAARFVCRSDVRSYYVNIDHDRLETMLADYISDLALLRLLRQYLHRTICRGENYRDIRCGIPLRSSLSPLMVRSTCCHSIVPWRNTRLSMYVTWTTG